MSKERMKPKTYVVRSPLGVFDGTVRDIVLAYNRQVDARNMPTSFKVCMSGFSRLVTGRNKSGHYKHIYPVV